MKTSFVLIRNQYHNKMDVDSAVIITNQAALGTYVSKNLGNSRKKTNTKASDLNLASELLSEFGIVVIFTIPA